MVSLFRRCLCVHRARRPGSGEQPGRGLPPKGITVPQRTGRKAAWRPGAGAKAAVSPGAPQAIRPVARAATTDPDSGGHGLCVTLGARGFGMVPGASQPCETHRSLRGRQGRPTQGAGGHDSGRPPSCYPVILPVCGEAALCKGMWRDTTAGSRPCRDSVNPARSGRKQR